jgi:hypothetical protein
MLRRLAATALLTCAFWIAAAAPAQAARTLTMALHTHLTFTGLTGSKPGAVARATGRIFVTASWRHGPWYAVATPRTDHNGRYRAQFKPTRRGSYVVKIRTPDGRTTTYFVHVR